MQQKFSTPGPGTQNTPKSSFWFDVACFLVGPITLVWGLVLRRKATRTGIAQPHAQKLILLGGVSTALFVCSSIWDAISKDEAPAPERTVSAAQAGPSTPALADTKKAEADRAEAEFVRRTARELVAARKELEAEVMLVETSTAQEKLGPARKALDALENRFGSLDRAAFHPDDKDDAATREALTTAGTLLASLDAARRGLATKELVVVTALVPVLRDPKNRAAEPLVLFTRVGKQFGLTGAEVQTIHSVHVEEAQRRIDALDEADRERLLAKCGSEPQTPSNMSGGLLVVETFVKKTANDPDSIEVENCTRPTLSEESCWVTACEVRGTNAFGAKVLNRVQVSISGGEVSSVL